MSGLYTFFIIIGVLAIIVCVIVAHVKSKIRQFSRQAFNTDNLMEGMKKAKLEESVTPKSICGMTRIFLPQIAKDFPEFNYEEFKTKSNNMLISAFNAISADDILKLVSASDELKRKVNSIIENNKDNGFDESYSHILIHRTEIADYRKNSGTCIITLQSSLEYMHDVKKNGTVIKGSTELKEQTRYNVEIIYIQDTSKLETNTGYVAVNCPNCGAPITNLGAKHCEYCGSAVEAINTQVWSINNYTEV